MRERIARYDSRRPLQTFSLFDLTHVNAMIRRASLAAQAYAERPDGWLVLHGNCGTGKSHLADAITDRRSVKPVMNHTVPALLDLLRSGYKNGDHGDLLDLCCNVHLLILDDIGTENPTDWSRKILFRIINHRYNRRLPTVLVFNGKPDDLPPRIASRVSDRDLATIYPMYGDDYRLRKDRGSTP
ncbi:MAG: ATP-binding protein [Anaerolineae bacterium]|nr:ATP-binding protein [Anaerolineae bacterium]